MWQAASPLEELAMQFHNYLFRQCARAWKTTWDTFSPLGNAIWEYVHVTNMWKTVLHWWIMKSATFFASDLCAFQPRAEQSLPSLENRPGAISFYCTGNLRLSAPSLTVHLKLIRGEMSYLIIFSHEHWSAACNFNWRAACPESFLKRGIHCPEINMNACCRRLWGDMVHNTEIEETMSHMRN